MGRERRDRSYLRGNFSQMACVHGSFKPSYPAQPHNAYPNRNSSPNASSAALILNNLIFSALEPSTLFILDNGLWCYARRGWHVLASTDFLDEILFSSLAELSATSARSLHHLPSPPGRGIHPFPIWLEREWAAVRKWDLGQDFPDTPLWNPTKSVGRCWLLN